ncbi:MAG: hypothetical protein V2J51_13025 [Erythrobacter sp.]|jgi:hypothetical protein|nr:hypothetical protein [Erythrobacter sp.]
MENLPTEIIGLLGVLVGVVITHISTIKLEKDEYLRQKRIEIYSELIELIANSALITTEHDLMISDRKIAFIRTQICLVGSYKTLRNSQEFWKHRDHGAGDGEQALIDLISGMRQDLGLRVRGNYSALEGALHQKFEK